VNGLFLRGQVPGDQAVHTAVDIPVSAYSTGPNHAEPVRSRAMISSGAL
jgi:hypothetical protein